MCSNDKKHISISRTLYFDYLRAFATISVIFIHVSAKYWYSENCTSTEWNILNFYDCITSWAVPVFIMISGALFLNNEKQINTKSLFTKNIKRIICCYIFWSALYSADQIAMGMALKSAILYFIRGNYHLWFLYMIMSLYVLIPLLRKITLSIETTRYYLFLALIFTFVLPQIYLLLTILNVPHTIPLLGTISDVADDFNFHFTIGYSSYFVLGYYLNTVNLKKSHMRAIYLLGIVGFAATIVLTATYSIRTNTPDTTFMKAFSLGLLLESTLIFTVGKHKLSHIKNHSILHSVLNSISKYSFGIYLVHALVIEKLDILLGFNAISFNPLIAVPTVVLSVLLISFAITFVLNKIPFIKKHFL